MFPPTGQPEAGPSTTTRSLRSRSPVKTTTTPAVRSSRARLSIPSFIMSSNADEAPHRASSTSSSSSHTATSGPTPVTEAISRPRRTYSRQHRLSSPGPSQPFLHPNYVAHTPIKATDSRSSSPLTSPSKTPVKSSPLPVVSKRKGKERAMPATVPRAERKPAPAAEKRVLPARIRRAAGTGADGIRDLEEMVVDWLERWGEPLETPPDSLVVHLTTLPLSLVDPPISTQTADAPPPPAPAEPVSAVISQDPTGGKERIEVPKWRKVKPGEDDEEEAKDELQIMSFSQRAGKGNLSPVKRLRHATAETPLEDTSDAYYMALHKKYEVFERRQRIREKETLQFERYKMRSRIDLLRGMSKTAWAAVVAVVLSRSALGPVAPVVKKVLKMGEVEAVLEAPPPRKEGDVDRWARGRVKIEAEGPDWLRDTLVKEGEEVMRRYDELLPPEHRKIADMSPAPTTSYSPSLSPPPVIPNRVAALRDHSSSAPRRQPAPSAAPAPKRLTLTLKARPPPIPADPEVHASGGRKRKRPAGETGKSDRRTRSKDAGPISLGGDKRRASLRSSTPLRPDEDVEMDEESISGSEADTVSSFGNIVATVPPARGHPAIKLHTPPISIRISRSSGTPTITTSITSGQRVGPATSTEPARSLRSTKIATGGAVQSNAPVAYGSGGKGELSPDEARELREVEAAVL